MAGIELGAAAFDWLLATMIVVLAALAAFARVLLTAIAGLIALGLVLAIAWARLGAVDVAIAEAVLGSGVLGGMLLKAWSGFAASAVDDDASMHVAPGALVLLALPAVLIAIGTVYAGHSADALGIGDAARAAIGATGVSHPVTAVLLDYRALDTLMELAVLLVAALAALSIGRIRLRARAPEPALEALLRLVVPLLILVAGVLLWRGAHAPGGAFHAGAALAAAAILVLLGWQQLAIGRALAFAGLALGVTVFSVLGALMLALGGLLDWPAEHAGSLILVVEIAATISIAFALLLLFAGGAPWPRAGEDQR